MFLIKDFCKNDSYFQVSNAQSQHCHIKFFQLSIDVYYMSVPQTIKTEDRGFGMVVFYRFSVSAYRYISEGRLLQ